MATLEQIDTFVLTLSYKEAAALKAALQFIDDTDAPGAQDGDMDHDNLHPIFEALDEVI